MIFYVAVINAVNISQIKYSPGHHVKARAIDSFLQAVGTWEGFLILYVLMFLYYFRRYYNTTYFVDIQQDSFEIIRHYGTKKEPLS